MFLLFKNRHRKKNMKETLEIAQKNLGYYAGYYDNETRKMVEELFFCEHPMFGSIKEKGDTTPEQAFEIGKKLGEILKKKTKITY